MQQLKLTTWKEGHENQNRRQVSPSLTLVSAAKIDRIKIQLYLL
jgi:hypothetical protein